MKKYISLSAVILCFLLGPVTFATAQNEEEINYSYGIVVSHSPEQLVVLEYDYDSDEEIEVSYEINAETAVENVESLDKLQKDDGVEVYYREKDGKKIAVSIEKELITDDTVDFSEELIEEGLPEVPMQEEIKPE